MDGLLENDVVASSSINNIITRKKWSSPIQHNTRFSTVKLFQLLSIIVRHLSCQLSSSKRPQLSLCYGYQFNSSLRISFIIYPMEINLILPYGSSLSSILYESIQSLHRISRTLPCWRRLNSSRTLFYQASSLAKVNYILSAGENHSSYH